MVTRKDFNLAAIRLFCDMIVADGLVVGSELAEFEKWQKDYGLTGDTLADEKIIQEAHGLTLGEAIEIINAYNIAMIKVGNCNIRDGLCKDVDVFINRLKAIALADGECTPNEAILLLAVNYVVRKREGVIFSIPGNRLRLSRREILVLEGDMDDTSFLRQLYLKIHDVQGCSLDFAGWKSLNTDKNDNNCVDDFFYFVRFIRVKHNAIIKELASNRELYHSKFSTYGFDLIDVRDCLSQLLDVSLNKEELLASALTLVNPATRRGLDSKSIKTIIENIRPSDITNSLFHGCEFKYIVPSFLVKVSNSTKWTLEGKVEKYTDVLLINIKGFPLENVSEEKNCRLLLTTIEDLLDNYVEPMGRLTHMVSVDIRKSFNVHGFHNTLLNYAIQKIGKCNGPEKVEIERDKQCFIFSFKERAPIQLKFEKPTHFIYYLLLMCLQRIPKRKRSLDFIDYDGKSAKSEIDGYKSRNKNYHSIFLSFNRLYSGTKVLNVYKVKAGSTDAMQVFHGQVIKAIKEQLIGVETDMFMPKIDHESDCYYLDTNKYRHLIFVVESSKASIPIDDWIDQQRRNGNIFL